MQACASALTVSGYFGVSSVAASGTDRLMQKVADYLGELDEEASEDNQIRQEVHEFSRQKRLMRKTRRLGDVEDHDDDHDVTVHYEP